MEEGCVGLEGYEERVCMKTEGVDGGEEVGGWIFGA